MVDEKTQNIIWTNITIGTSNKFNFFTLLVNWKQYYSTELYYRKKMNNRIIQDEYFVYIFYWSFLGQMIVA